MRAREPPYLSLESNPKSTIGRASESGKSEHLGILLIRQIVDTPESRESRINFVLGSKIHEDVILNVEIRAAEIQFFARVLEFRFDLWSRSFLSQKLR